MTREFRKKQIKSLRERVQRLQLNTPYSRKIEPLLAKLQPLVHAELKAENREKQNVSHA